MNRRELLASTGALAAGGLAGCLADGPAGDGEPDGGGTDEPGTDTRTASEEPTASPTAALGDQSFAVENVGAGTGENSASVHFGEPIVVEGTIAGNNGCYWARLQSAELADGTLSVVVEAYEREDEDACTQALVDIDYRATFPVSGPGPSRVVVTHVSMGETHTVADETA